MKAADLQVGDRVLVRLDGRDRTAVVRAFDTAAGGAARVQVTFEARGEHIWITTRRIVRRVGRGALTRARAPRANDARTREDG